MKTTVYTYVNRKVVLVEKPRFYFLKDKAEFDAVVDDLIEIDAVSSPADLTFPCILELRKGFSISLKEVTVEQALKAIQGASKDLETYKQKLVKFL